MGVRQLATKAAQGVAIRGLLAAERMRTGATFNPLDKRYYSDPYPLYKRLRERDAGHRSNLVGGYVFTRHADVTAVLRDPRFISDGRKQPNWPKQRAQALAHKVAAPEELDRQFLLNLDPPDHTRIRSLVTKAFTPRTVEGLRARVEAIVAEILDAAAERGEFDIIGDLAYPLPVIVIAELLGVPAEDRAQFKRWSDDAAQVLGFGGFDEMRVSYDAQRELRAYLARVAEERRREPREDLLSALMAAEESDDRLDIDEVLSLCILLLVAGHETTTNLIGNGMLALMHDREQYGLLRRDPSLISQAVEELLRFDSPVQATGRFPQEDAEIAGVTVRGGQQVIVLLGAANRDPEAFADPDRLDITREDNRHLSFSHGIHYCLGAPLARLEAQVAIAAIAERFPDIRPATGALKWRENFILHGVESLPVRW